MLTNIDVLRPGMTLREFSERCWPVPERYLPNRYMLMVHGAGLVDETPAIAYAVDFDDWGYDGLIEEGMVLCVESFIGEVGGREGVKLEEQVLVTANGAVPLSSSPLVDAPPQVDDRTDLVELFAVSGHNRREPHGQHAGPWPSPCCCAPMVPSSPSGARRRARRVPAG